MPTKNNYFNVDQLPRRARHPQDLPLFRRPVRLMTMPVEEQIGVLRKVGLPQLASPCHFVEDIIKVEKTLGTVPAIIACQVAVCHESRFNVAAKGLRLFDELSGVLSATVRTAGEEGLSLYLFCDPSLIFKDRNGTDLVQGLETFLGNLRATDAENRLPVGNCQVNALLMGMLGISLGLQVEEERLISNPNYKYVHSGVQLISRTQAFLYQTIREEGDTENRALFKSVKPSVPSEEGNLTSGAYSLVATLFVNKVLRLSWGKNLDGMSRREKLRLLKILSCAEAINPYNDMIYKLRSKIYASLGNLPLAEANLAWAKAVGKLQVGSHGLPVVS